MGAVPPLFYGLTVSFLTMNRNPSLKKSKFRLLIQQLSDGPQLGFSKVRCGFVHEDVDNDILWKLRLNEHQQPPEIVRDIVVEIEG